MSNKWNKVLEAESISKCNQRLPFSSTPRKEVFSFGRRSSHRNCEKQCVGDFRVQHNVQCISRLWRIFTKKFPTTKQESFWRAASQINWEFFWGFTLITTYQHRESYIVGMVNDFQLIGTLNSVLLKQLKWFPIYDEVNRTDQRFSEILLCLIYGHLGGH